MASITAELTWLSFLLRDIGVPLLTPPTLFCDNMSALHMSINPVFHARTKHVELDYHFVHEKVSLGSLITQCVSTKAQLANILTKPLPKLDFNLDFSNNRTELGLQPRPSLRGSNEIAQESTSLNMESSSAQT